MLRSNLNVTYCLCDHIGAPCEELEGNSKKFLTKWHRVCSCKGGYFSRLYEQTGFSLIYINDELAIL